MGADVETIVVGAGVIGLAIARSLTMRGQEVLVLERHERIGKETTSRNSEVIHAGLYYPPGSLKARLCVAGKDLLYAFSAENGVAAPRCGKLLVATSEGEVPRLEAVAANARANGVHDLRRLSRDEARALEPEVECVAAYLSPSTGVIDSHGLLTALDGHLMSRGGAIVLSTNVRGITRRDGSFRLACLTSPAGSSVIACRRLVLAAGLAASDVAAGLLAGGADYRIPRTYFAKGHYFALSGKAPFSRLIYPLPGAGGLGVHLTLDVAGRAKFGPDVEWTDRIDYGFDEADGRRREAFEAEIRRYWPGLPSGALHPDMTGIRPKLTPRDAPPADFAIHGPREHGMPRVVALYGIESPGLTASLAIGELVADLLELR